MPAAHKAAAEFFRRTLKLKRDGDERLRLLAEVAQVWLENGQPLLAAGLYEALETLAPDAPVGPLGLAEIHLMHEQYAEARDAAARAIACKHNDALTLAFAHELRSAAHRGLGDEQQAAQDWQRARELAP